MKFTHVHLRTMFADLIPVASTPRPRRLVVAMAAAYGHTPLELSTTAYRFGTVRLYGRGLPR